MIDARKKTETGSDEIQPGSEGGAEPSREVAGTGAEVHGPAGNGQENRNKKNDGQEGCPRLVERKTELRCLGICARKEKKSVVRRRTEQDIHAPDPEVPYVRTERAIRDLVCSLMERQDRMNEEIFLQLNDLKYRLDDLEDAIDDQKAGRPQ